MRIRAPHFSQSGGEILLKLVPVVEIILSHEADMEERRLAAIGPRTR